MTMQCSVAYYGSEYHSRPNSGFAAAETDATTLALVPTFLLREAERANGGMEFQHFPNSKPPSRQDGRHVAEPRKERSTSERTAATGSFFNWHRLTPKKTSDDKKVDVLSRSQNAESGLQFSSSKKGRARALIILNIIYKQGCTRLWLSVCLSVLVCV